MNPPYRLVSHLLRILHILIITYGVRGYHGKRQQSRPIFLPTETNITVHLGGVAVLKCKIENLGPKTVVWRRVLDEYPITVGKLLWSPSKNILLDHQQIDEKVSQWDLVIKNVTPKNEGLYECQVSAAETYTYNVYLTVLKTRSTESPGYEWHPLDRDYYQWRDKASLEEPYPAISLKGTEYVNLYQSINLTCNATGPERAPDSIDWFHDGLKIIPGSEKWNGRLTLSNYVMNADPRGKSGQFHSTPGRSLISNLVINRSSQEDSGNYVCRSWISSNVETTFLKIHVLNDDKNVGERDTNEDVPIEEALGAGNKTSSLISDFSLLLIGLLISIR